MPGGAALSPWPRKSGAITRQISDSAVTCGCQMARLKGNPCTNKIGSPCPSSTKARRMPLRVVIIFEHQNSSQTEQVLQATQRNDMKCCLWYELLRESTPDSY